MADRHRPNGIIASSSYLFWQMTAPPALTAINVTARRLRDHLDDRRTVVFAQAPRPSQRSPYEPAQVAGLNCLREYIRLGTELMRGTDRRSAIVASVACSLAGWRAAIELWPP